MRKSHLLGDTMISTPLHAGSGTMVVRTMMIPPASTMRAVQHRISRRERQEEERTNRDNRLSGWIRDQLERDIEALGGGPVIQTVTRDYRGYIVRMLQWQANGIATVHEHHFCKEHCQADPEVEEARMRKSVSARFKALLQNQAERVRDLGPPHAFTPEDVDMSRYAIDMPLAAIMTHVFGSEAGSILRKAMVANDKQPYYDTGWKSDPRMAQRGMRNLDLSYPRDAIRGSFTYEDKGITFVWSKGALAIYGVTLPDAVWTGATGRRLGDLVEHPLFAESMIITAVQPTRMKGGGGRTGWTLTLKDFLGPMPKGW